jgi:hypothetical protein
LVAHVDYENILVWCVKQGECGKVVMPHSEGPDAVGGILHVLEKNVHDWIQHPEQSHLDA